MNKEIEVFVKLDNELHEDGGEYTFENQEFGLKEMYLTAREALLRSIVNEDFNIYSYELNEALALYEDIVNERHLKNKKIKTRAENIVINEYLKMHNYRIDKRGFWYLENEEEVLTKESAKFIKETRIKNNLTEEEFGKKYNVSAKTVEEWESGVISPDFTVMLDLCDIHPVNDK